MWSSGLKPSTICSFPLPLEKVQEVVSFIWICDSRYAQIFTHGIASAFMWEKTCINVCINVCVYNCINVYICVYAYIIPLFFVIQVEITCRGQPVVPNLPLEKVQGIWLATNPPSSTLLPALKELNSASHDDRNWVRFKGRSAEHCMMILTYARHPRQVTGPWMCNRYRSISFVHVPWFLT